MIGRWTVVQRKTQKTFSHVSEIMRKILQSRLESVGGMHQAAELAERDPRRIPELSPQSHHLQRPSLWSRKNQDSNKQTFNFLCQAEVSFSV